MAKAQRPRGRPGLNPAEAARVRRVLAELLREQNDNCSAAARILGLSPSAVHQLRSKKNQPSYETARKLAKARGVEVSVLLAGGA